jgi:hypothetical protein
VFLPYAFGASADLAAAFRASVSARLGERSSTTTAMNSSPSSAGGLKAIAKADADKPSIVKLVRDARKYSV